MSVVDSFRSIITTDHRKYDKDGPLCLYRCTECGHLAFTLGGLHGHIEGHRPLRHFWRIGWDVEWLQDRTELLWLAEASLEEAPPVE